MLIIPKFLQILLMIFWHLLVFGIYGKIFHLAELSDDGFEDEHGLDDLNFVVNISVALFIGFLVTLLMLRCVNAK